MSTPILATKLYIPPPRPKAVQRARLIERLNEGAGRKLALISAPAGFGKSTLVSEWLASGARAAAWLSLDEGDNDPTRFLSYLVAALQTIAPAIGEGLLALLHSSQPATPESMLTALINEIATLAKEVVLVLDDYHVIENKAIDQALTFLLEHLPPHFHLVITTREDPQLPIARVRARGHLSELRAADLRFSLAEAVQFLNQVMSLGLAEADIAILESRTEGWIAGLQLAALSMQGQQDLPKFIAEFAGDHRYIVDYLAEEVLQRQPEDLRRFLYQTAILTRLCGPLCDAVTGQNGGSARLEALERGNFFVVPLDNRRYWVRYHPLFAEVLTAHLLEEQPEELSVLHQRASLWYAQNDLPADAIRHAFAAKDFTRVADLLEEALPAMGRNREGPTLLAWLKALPAEIISVRPVLCVGYAWASLAGGDLEAVEPWLQRGESLLESVAEMRSRPHPEGSPIVVANEEIFRRLPGMIAIYRAGVAQILGNVADAVKYARRVLEIVPEEDDLERGAGTALLGLALWTSGDLESAYQSYAKGMARVQQAGNISDVINSANSLAGIRAAQGRLREAMSIYEHSLLFAAQQGDSHRQATADHYVGMSELAYEQNDLEAAMQHLLQSKEVSERSPLPHNRSRWSVAMARIRQAQGAWEEAAHLLDEAERLYVRDFFPNVRPVAAFKARLWLAQGRVDEALGWAQAKGLSADDELQYLAEFEQITLARVLLARALRDRAGNPKQEAIALLGRLLKAAEAGDRRGSVIEILLLHALAHQQQGQIPATLAALERALTLAEPEGYVRIFVDEGAVMATLLEEAVKAGISPTYARRLLAAFGTAGEVTPNNESRAKESRAKESGVAQGAFGTDPLSERELQVLRLLATDLSGPEIARELVVSQNTMNTHIKNIYSKLGVNSRRAAVRRAEELDLI